jgi:tetratricopeptide (TPR) repeat protein
MQPLNVRGCLFLAVCAVAASPLSADTAAYARHDFGFVAQVPDEWSIYAERDQGDQFIVAFGLPSTWSKLEQQPIENSVSITAYRRGTLRSVSDVVDLEAERTRDIVVSREEVPSDSGRMFLVVSEIEGLRYKSLASCHFANETGYVVLFTATEGTYDINVDKFAGFLQNVSFVPPQLDRYRQARILYSDGPSRAPEIIALLEAELADNPDHEEAIRLLGITYFGIDQPQEALVQFERALEIAAARDTMLPGMLMYKARALHDLGRDIEAKKILDVYWALWQDSKKLQGLYEYLYPLVGGAEDPGKKE